MSYSLESSILRLQMDGIFLYSELAEVLAWLGYTGLSDYARTRFLALAKRNLATRRQIIKDCGEIVFPRGMLKWWRPLRRRKPEAKERSGYVLEWQDGTEEPEDEPNDSNGEDVIYRPLVTVQPWMRRRESGSMTMNESMKKSVMECAMDRCASYEINAWKLYSNMVGQNPIELWKEARYDALKTFAHFLKKH